MCVTNNDRPEQEAMVYTVTRRDNIYIQPVLDPEYGNALAEYVPPLSKFLYIDVLLDLQRWTVKRWQADIDPLSSFKT